MLQPSRWHLHRVAAVHVRWLGRGVCDGARRRLECWDAAVEAATASRAPPTSPDRDTSATVSVGVVSPSLPAAARQELRVPLASWTPASHVPHLPTAPARPVVAAAVNGVAVDLDTALACLPAAPPPDAPLHVDLLCADSAEGQQVMWHSAAHVLGSAMESVFGDSVLLTDGPPLRVADGGGGGGFFYELHLRDGTTLSDAMYPAVVKAAKGIIRKKHRFERVVVDRDTARRMFADNPFKLRVLAGIPAHEVVTVYRCGDFVDMCRGPHVRHTGVFKAFTVTKSSGSHVPHPDAPDENVLLQRMYGMAFAAKEDMTAWQHVQAEAKRRDHRVIGKAQSLFMFHDMSPGSAFVLPHGTRVYNALIDFLRDEYRDRGYDEVMSPLLYRPELWATSGHWDNYREHMFMVSGGGDDGAPARGATDDDGVQFGLKPMNCPGHCLIFASRTVSYRELPIRLADFSSLHRNEASGALGGMTRLRRFQQDDAHIFCTTDQMEGEVRGCLDMVHRVYAAFGFKFRFLLSTRPDKFMGDKSTWEQAEAALANALDAGSHPYEVEEGEGAFYGPKIDTTVSDALGREHQCATIQLDFQLPRNFNLEYSGPDGASHQPVMIHRAILGSLERMMAVLIEHYAGRWPFWLSPRHVAVCPVGNDHHDTATSLAASLKARGLFADVELSDRTIPKRIRLAQSLQYNLVAVVGDVEVANGTVAVRFRDAATLQEAQDVVRRAVADGTDVDMTAHLAPVVDSVADGNTPVTVTLPAAALEWLCLRMGRPPPPANR